MKMLIHSIKPHSYVDGPGERTVLFMQGCPIFCQGCQNTRLWTPERGHLEETVQVATSISYLTKPHGNVTISGGEPFAQLSALHELVMYLRMYEIMNIIVYTGYTYEQLRSGIAGNWFRVMDILESIDTLVDGPFIKELDDSLIMWRGSRNQRPINTRLTLNNHNTIITHDWDTPRLTITQDGDALMPAGMVQMMDSLGKPETTRMCGQTKK